MADYISRNKAANVLCMACGNAACDPFECSFYKEMEDIPPADVVTREAFNRILAENDDMREQLAKIGKKPGDKMDDVRTYAIAKLVSAELAPPRMKFCSRCWARKPNTGSSFCSSCGADMRNLVEIDQVKEDAE